MRDYTRKAKIKDSNEWVIGYHVYVDYLDKHYILVSEKTDDGFSGMLAMKQYEVDGDTICEPTGLNDKNGNKIWENDIVNGHEKRGAAFFQCVVKHNDRKARFDVEAMGCMFPLCIEEYDEDFFMNGFDYEVIGNIFDNACIDELLKGEEG